MPYYPVLLDLRGRKALVVGGGAVATRKIETLVGCGAVVHVIARELSPEIGLLVEEGKIEHIGREFREDALEGAFLVVAATDEASLNHRISVSAKGRGLLVNAVDQPSDCNFIVPSVLRRGDLLISVSTSGKSPALAKKVREELERLFVPEYGPFLTLLGRLRRDILEKDLSQDENRRIFEELVHSPLLDAIVLGDWMQVASILTRVLSVPISDGDVLRYMKGD